MNTIPHRAANVAAILPPCPEAGTGAHVWLMSAANRCRNAGLSEEQTVEELAARLTREPNPANEVEQAARKAFSETGGARKITPAWPPVNKRQRQAVISAGLGLAQLVELSPVRWGDSSPHTEEIIDALFPGNPLLCCGQSSRIFATRAREDWRGLLQHRPLIVPSPMTARTGLTKAGHIELAKDWPKSKSYLDNDAGHAERYCDRYAGEIGYVPEWDIWLTWEERWKRDTSGGLVRRAIELSKEMMDTAISIPATDPELKHRTSEVKAAAKWGDIRVIRPMLDLSKACLGVHIPASKIDADPWLIGAKNAVIDLQTGVGRNYTPEDLVTQTLGARYDASVACPRWEQFMEEIFPDKDVRHYIHKAVGYSLTGIMREKCFFFLHGCGDNGKSVFLTTLERVLGEYAEQASKGLTVAPPRGEPPLRELAKIVGKRLVLAGETEDREKLNTVVIKSITGGDSMEAAALYKNRYTFQPACKIWFAGNHKPSVPDTGPALWGRVRLIPFDRVFSAEEMDRELESKLAAEASGILNWMLRGCLLWQAEGLDAPAIIVAAGTEYRREEDILGDFLEECVSPEASAVTPHKHLYTRYREWADETGIKLPLTRVTLAKKLRERGWKEAPRSGRAKVAWLGVTLRMDGSALDLSDGGL